MADTLTHRKSAAFYIKRALGALLLLGIAGVFLFSAYSKLKTFDAFVWSFLDIGFSNADTAAMMARIFIGIEASLGLFLLLHLYLKAVTYPATLALLGILTIYLVVLIIKQGNTGNCGCFGNFIYMKPLTAIWKNLIMMGVVVLLMYIYPVKPYKNQEWIAALVGMAGLVAPFIMEPPNFDHQPTTVNRNINMDALYMQGKPQPSIDVRKGKHIVAFMSLTCPHCKKAAYLLHIMKRSHPDFPIMLVLAGHADQQEEFFKESKAEDVPHFLFNDPAAFTEMAGDAVPAIYWINNSRIEKQSNYYQIDPEKINTWLHQ